MFLGTFHCLLIVDHCTCRYWLLPGFLLKKMIMDNFSSEEVDPDIADSVDFLVEKVKHPILLLCIRSSLGGHLWHHFM